MSGVGGTAIRSRGCVVTEEYFEDPVEKERLNKQRQMDRDVEQRVGEKVKQVMDAQRKTCTRCAGNSDQLFRQMESDIRKQLIELSLCIAETILRRELPDEDMLRHVLSDALEPITDFQGVQIRIAPTDADLLLGACRDAAPGAKGMEWVVDPNLASGDLLVESRNGIFDGRLRQRLSSLAEAIEKAGSRSSESGGSET